MNPMNNDDIAENGMINQTIDNQTNQILSTPKPALLLPVVPLSQSSALVSTSVPSNQSIAIENQTMTPQVQSISDPVLKYQENTVPKTTKEDKKALPIPIPLPKPIMKQESLSRSSSVVPLFVSLSTPKPTSEPIQSVSVKPLTKRIVHQEVKAVTPKPTSSIINEDTSVKSTNKIVISKQRNETTLSLNPKTDCQGKPIDRSVHQERNATTGSLKRLSVSDEDKSKNTSDRKLSDSTPSQSPPSKIEKILMSELVLGLVYLLVGLMMGQEIGLASLPFLVTGCTALLLACLQQFNNRLIILVSRILGILSLGLIVLEVCVYFIIDSSDYYYLDTDVIDGIKRLYWHRSIVGYECNALFHIVYWLFFLLTFSLPVVSVMITTYKLKEVDSSTKRNAFSILRNVKGKWYILVETLLGFGLMIASVAFTLCLDDYKTSDLKNHHIIDSSSMLYIVFINGLIYLVIVYLQCHAERRKEGCINGMVWGVLSCVIHLACYSYMEDILGMYDNRIECFFLVISIITWIITPLSVIIMYQNDNSRNTKSSHITPLKHQSATKSKKKWKGLILPVVFCVITIGVVSMIAYRCNTKQCSKIDLVIGYGYDDCSRIHGSRWRSIIIRDGFCNNYKTDSLKVRSECLEAFIVGVSSLKEIKQIDISDVPKLTTFITGEKSFYETRSLSISSMMMIYD